MSDDFRKQLYRNFNQKSTDELVEIWQTNNRGEWAEMTFDVIREILLERHTELPSQNEPIYGSPSTPLPTDTIPRKIINHLTKHHFYLHLSLTQALLTYLGCVILIWLLPPNALNEGLFIPIILAFTAFSILSPIVNLFLPRWWLNIGLFILSWVLLLYALYFAIGARIGSPLGEAGIMFLLPMQAATCILPLTGLVRLILFLRRNKAS